MSKRLVSIPQHLKESYAKAMQTGIERNYEKSAPIVLEASRYDEIDSYENGNYLGRVTFFLEKASLTCHFEYSPSRDIWRVTHDWND